MRFSRVTVLSVGALVALWITACSAGPGPEAPNSTPTSGSTFGSAQSPSLSASGDPPVCQGWVRPVVRSKSI